MKIGYVRVSKKIQSYNLQIDALEKEGCLKIFLETASGAQRDRPQLKEALSLCEEGDTLVVWKLDRLARSTKQLIETVEMLNERGITFLSLTEDIDTKGSVGNLIFHIFASLAQFERDIIRDRVVAGLEAARLRGRVGGRPRTITNEKLRIAKTLLDEDKMTIKQICNHLNISVSTFYTTFKGGRGANKDGVLRMKIQ